MLEYPLVPSVEEYRSVLETEDTCFFYNPLCTNAFLEYRQLYKRMSFLIRYYNENVKTVFNILHQGIELFEFLKIWIKEMQKLGHMDSLPVITSKLVCSSGGFFSIENLKKKYCDPRELLYILLKTLSDLYKLSLFLKHLKTIGKSCSDHGNQKFSALILLKNAPLDKTIIISSFINELKIISQIIKLESVLIYKPYDFLQYKVYINPILHPLIEDYLRESLKEEATDDTNSRLADHYSSFNVTILVDHASLEHAKLFYMKDIEKLLTDIFN